MDNIGDWLYIVLLIVAGISSMFGSGKKKKRPSTILGQPDKDIVTEEPSDPQKGFWEILQEIQNEPAPTEKPKKKASKKTKPADQPFLSAESTLFNQQTHSTSAKQTQPIEEEPGIMPDTAFTDMAELRKAIICSEILNRKY